MKIMRAVFLVCAAMVIAGIVAGLMVFARGLILTDMDDRVPWGIWEAAYIFCTGLSAGSFVISSLGLFGMKAFKPLGRVGVTQAVILLLIAPVFLLLALGRPERFYYIYFYANPTSVIAWGAYLLAIYPIVCGLYGYYQMRRDMGGTALSQEEIEKHDRRAKFWGLLGVPVAICVHGYTGVLLGFIKGRVLWNTPLMPVLFLTSAIVSGIALLIVILVIMNKITDFKTEKSLIQLLATIMLVTLILDVFFMACELMTGIYVHGSEHYEAWSVLFSGLGGWMFLGVELLIGAAVPIILLAFMRKSIKATVAASIMIMIGVFAMRCNIILGGQVIQPYGGPHGNYFPTLNEWVIMLGIFAFGTCLYIVSVKYLPLGLRPVTSAENLQAVKGEN